MIRIELELLRTATTVGSFDYLHLLSGQDLPIKTMDEIHAWFDTHPGNNYIDRDPDPVRQENATERIAQYYFFHDSIGRKKEFGFRCLRKMEECFRKVQKKLQVDRTRKIPIKIYKGTNWFSITQEMAREVLKHQKEIREWFRWSFCADEIFLQTIAYNSPLKETIVNDALREIDWMRGSPYIYTSEDEEMLRNSPKLFARKFSTSVDTKIIDRIRQRKEYC